jgi:hypothetical protein
LASREDRQSLSGATAQKEGWGVLSVWDRKSWRGTLQATINAGGTPPVGSRIGVLEWDSVATNLDVLVDFSDTEFALGNSLLDNPPVFFALYTFSGNQKVYRAQFFGNPVTGMFQANYPIFPPSGLSDPQGTAIPSGLASVDVSNTFLLQASGNAAQGWGIEVGLAQSIDVTQITRLFVCGIAHGVEVPATP